MAATTGRTGAPAWQWSRTAETRRTLLDAARAVFIDQGFAKASVADIVERAGSSVGSLYHHFGGKTEIFLALYEEYQAAQETNAAAAVARARAEGEDDPVELFVVGTRAFLDGAWEHRDVVRLFLDGDTPPGFEGLRRSRTQVWTRQNSVLLGTGGGTAVDRLFAAMMTTATAEAGREIAICPTEAEAAELATATVSLVRRVLGMPREAGS